MTQKTLKINTENILPIIKKWLYTDKEIFLRELVSNACDAIRKLEVLGEASGGEIFITLDKEKKTLTISDTGIGMTAEEVEKYIADVAFSGAKEFAEKYEEADGVIGHFGLGFYSAYMVASSVEIDTLSYQKEAEAAHWVCDGSVNYTLEKGSQAERGTRITLHIEDEEFLDDHRLRRMLNHYCAFLPYPIHFSGEQINKDKPLWMKAPSDCTDEEYLKFYHDLYPTEPDPLFWVHLNVNFPFHLKGILYFPKIHDRFDFQKNVIKLFCNRVFVSDNCKDLLPEYLTVLRGALDSPDIPLNVSRSTLQMDKTVRQLGSHISKKVADRLAGQHRADPEAFFKHWENIELIIKLGALQEEKFFEKVKNFLVWKNLNDEWITLEEYKNRSSSDKVFYTQQKDSHFHDLYKEKNLEVLQANGHLDPALMSFLESKNESLKFQRIDAELHEELVEEKTDEDGEKMAEFVKETLGDETLTVKAEALSSPSIPAMVTLDEQMRRMRDQFALHSGEFPEGMGPQKTLVINTKSPLIQALAKLENKELAKELLQEVHELALLSQKELPVKAIPELIGRTNRLLERLLTEK